MNEITPEQSANIGLLQPSLSVNLSEAIKQPRVPEYLQSTYWWAYVHPRAVKVFERKWLVNLILIGNYARMREAALAELGSNLDGQTLQVACVYGDLSARLLEHIAPSGTLDVVDVLPIQLQNLRRKLPADPRVAFIQNDSTAMTFADASHDRALAFFLLHEQPENVRRATLAEMFRVVKPGGKIVLVDYHRPSRNNPLRYPMQALLGSLEPFAADLWRHELQHFFPSEYVKKSVRTQLYFGGLY